MNHFLKDREVAGHRLQFMDYPRNMEALTATIFSSK
jgi:hypothetical protein